MKPQFRWTKTSTAILGSFVIILFVIGYVWWPLLQDYLNQYDPEVAIWRQVDWLLIGNFLVMSILITMNADLRHDIPFGLIALFGGLVIETWGTQSGLWTYYTFEKPPLWIIPAWPIAALSVNRLYHIFLDLVKNIQEEWFRWTYWPVFTIFFGLLLNFIWPTITHPLTILSVILCLYLILSCQDKRSCLIILLVGTFLGYFLERWGTTRLCWTYYTGGTPPFFTTLAHGMASVAVWRVYKLYLRLGKRWKLPWLFGRNHDIQV